MELQSSSPPRAERGCVPYILTATVVTAIAFRRAPKCLVYQGCHTSARGRDDVVILCDSYLIRGTEAMDETTCRFPEVQAMTDGASHIESRFSNHLEGV